MKNTKDFIKDFFKSIGISKLYLKFWFIYKNLKMKNYILIVSHQRKYAFVMFPKSGSSTIQYVLSNLHKNEFNINDPATDFEDTHEQFNHIDARNLPENYKLFVCVREPYSRVCSMFFNRELDIAGNHNNSKTSPTVASSKTFRQFVDMLSRTPDKFLDHHFRTQKHNIPKDRITHCFELKNLSKELPRVLTTVGFTLDEVMPYMERKEVLKKNLDITNNFNEGSLADYNFLKDSYHLNVVENGVPPNTLMYDKELRRKVRERFSYDFKTYNFPD